jgi:hypothetical protein
MSEKMTLEQVRDGLTQLVKQCARTSVYEPIQEENCAKMASMLEGWIEAIDANLAATKAQTVDVPNIIAIIKESRILLNVSSKLNIPIQQDQAMEQSLQLQQAEDLLTALQK